MTVPDSALEDVLRYPVTVACPECLAPTGERCHDAGTANRRGDTAQHMGRQMAAVRLLFKGASSAPVSDPAAGEA